MASTNVPDNVTVPDFILEKMLTHGNAVALIDAATNSQYTFADVIRRVEATRNALRARGLRQGHVVCMYCENSLHYPIIWFAASSIGGVITTANPAYNPDEVSRQLLDCDAKFIIASQETFQNAKIAAIKAKNTIEVITHDGDSDITKALTSPPANGVTERLARDSSVNLDPGKDLFAIIYSSGTTGLPKGVMLTHRNMLYNLTKHVAAEERQLDGPNPSRHTHIIFMPLYHVFGINTLMTSLCMGDACVLLPRFDFIHFLAAIQRYKVSSLPLVPPIAVMLAKDPRVSNYDLSTIKSSTCGASTLHQEIIDIIQQRQGFIIRPVYGLTESSGMVTFTPKGHCKRGSIGAVAPLTEVKIVDVANGTKLGTNISGEICVKSASVMTGYLNNDAATRSTIDDQGWLHTGDLGYVDEDGHLFITGRIKELIKYKGFQVAPVELEGVLLEHPAVADAAVVGIPDDAAGELPRAIVVKKDGHTISELDIIDYIKDKLAPYKRLRGGVEFVKFIPKSPSGKILRQQIIAEQQTKRPRTSKL